MTYASKLRAEHELQRLGNFPAKRKMSADAAAEIALKKLSGGYKKRDPKCPSCYVLLPKTQICTFCS